jgi:hypothetical protein
MRPEKAISSDKGKRVRDPNNARVKGYKIAEFTSPAFGGRE